jgi:uncharacterized protein YggU (UPF0235/DUF167 family)
MLTEEKIADLEKKTSAVVVTADDSPDDGKAESNGSAAATGEKMDSNQVQIRSSNQGCQMFLIQYTKMGIAGKINDHKINQMAQMIKKISKLSIQTSTKLYQNWGILV